MIQIQAFNGKKEKKERAIKRTKKKKEVRKNLIKTPTHKRKKIKNKNYKKLFPTHSNGLVQSLK